MNHLRTAAMTIACLAMLGGCATRDRAVSGNSVRAAMAAQVIPPQPGNGKDNGTDAAAAMAGHANYVRSYVTPMPQGDSAMVGSGFGR